MNESLSPNPVPDAFTTTRRSLPASPSTSSPSANTSAGSLSSRLTIFPPWNASRRSRNMQYTIGLTHHVRYSQPHLTRSSGSSSGPRIRNPSMPSSAARPAVRIRYAAPGASRYSTPRVQVMPASGCAAASAPMRPNVRTAMACSRASSPSGPGGTHRLCAPPHGDV